jgi:tRNA(Ile)-lysidine synthase
MPSPEHAARPLADSLTGRAQALVDELLPRCTFPPGDGPLIAAVSGGADSLALLVLAVSTGRLVTAIHVDHGLRPDSAADGELVRRVAGSLGAACEVVSVEVAAGPNLEARARLARSQALPPAAMTGHTADDQAETVLLNLLRGSGLDGLAAMRPGPSHPLLALRRAETAALCAACGLAPVQDPTNDDLRHLRNRVRHELLPALAAAAGRDLVPVLARQADLLRDEAALLDGLAAAIDPTDARALAAAPVALARRALRHWLADPYPPDAAAVERVLAVARGEAIACEVDGGRRIERHAQRLSLLPPR